MHQKRETPVKKTKDPRCKGGRNVGKAKLCEKVKDSWCNACITKGYFLGEVPPQAHWFWDHPRNYIFKFRRIYLPQVKITLQIFYFSEPNFEYVKIALHKNIFWNLICKHSGQNGRVHA